MNNVVGWLKSNVLIVVFVVLIIAMPIGGYFGASVWNSKIKSGVEEELSSKKRQVDSVSTVTYTLPPIAEGEQPLEERRAPNAEVTAFYAEQRATRQAEIEDVVSRAVSFNKTEDRSLLVEGSLPGTGDEREASRKAREVAELIVGDDDRPSVYRALFDELNAGMPADEAGVARRVVDAYRAEVDRAGGNLSSLTAEEQAALDERLRSSRYSAYVRRAEELSVYGSVRALHGADASGFSVIPTEVPSGRLTEADALRWQMDYWLVEDLLTAVDTANRTRDGLRTEVPRSPVKRIVSVRLGEMTIPDRPQADASGTAGGQNTGRGNDMTFSTRRPTPMGGTSGGAVQETTHTGHTEADQNGVFKVRRAKVTLIVSSADLVRVLESFGDANFMTVTGVRLSEVDRWADLAEGYYYGSEHVVRAEIDVEAAYLHFWLADIVPGYVAEAWGIERPAAQADAGP